MLALTQAPSGAVAFNLKPNASLKTIQIRHGSSFRFREERRTVAFAMVLRRDAQNVRERFYPGKDSDALPALVWGGIAMETALGRRRIVSLRYVQLGKIRAASRVGCPF